MTSSAVQENAHRFPTAGSAMGKAPLGLPRDVWRRAELAYYRSGGLTSLEGICEFLRANCAFLIDESTLVSQLEDVDKILAVERLAAELHGVEKKPSAVGAPPLGAVRRLSRQLSNLVGPGGGLGASIGSRRAGGQQAPQANTPTTTTHISREVFSLSTSSRTPTLPGLELPSLKDTPLHQTLKLPAPGRTARFDAATNSGVLSLPQLRTLLERLAAALHLRVDGTAPEKERLLDAMREADAFSLLLEEAQVDRQAKLLERKKQSMINAAAAEAALIEQAKQPPTVPTASNNASRSKTVVVGASPPVLAQAKGPPPHTEPVDGGDRTASDAGPQELDHSLSVDASQGPADSVRRSQVQKYLSHFGVVLPDIERKEVATASLKRSESSVGEFGRRVLDNLRKTPNLKKNEEDTAIHRGELVRGALGLDQGHSAVAGVFQTALKDRDEKVMSEKERQGSLAHQSHRHSASRPDEKANHGVTIRLNDAGDGMGSDVLSQIGSDADFENQLRDHEERQLRARLVDSPRSARSSTQSDSEVESNDSEAGKGGHTLGERKLTRSRSFAVFAKALAKMGVARPRKTVGVEEANGDVPLSNRNEFTGSEQRVESNEHHDAAKRKRKASRYLSEVSFVGVPKKQITLEEALAEYYERRRGKRPKSRTIAIQTDTYSFTELWLGNRTREKATGTEDRRFDGTVGKVVHVPFTGDSKMNQKQKRQKQDRRFSALDSDEGGEPPLQQQSSLDQAD